MTKEQTSALKSQLGSAPGWFSLGVLALLIVLVAVVGGKFLASSTALAIGALVVIILVTFALTSWVGDIIARRRMSGLIVEPAQGAVVWKNTRYVAESDGRSLDPITNGLGLQPGDYTFYVIHGTKWLLSADTAGAVSSSAAAPSLDALRAVVDRGIDFDPQQSPDKAAQRLAELEQAAQQFRSFDENRIDKQAALDLMHRMTDQMKLLTRGQGVQGMIHLAQVAEQASRPPLDAHGLAELATALEQVGVMNQTALDANRQGQLTNTQRGALLKDLRSNLLWAAVVLVGGLYFLYLLYSKHDFSGMLPVGGFAALIELIFVVQARNELSDLFSGRALMLEGIVTKYTRVTHGSRGGSHTHYYYRIDPVGLEVSSTAYDALIEGTYRVYYLPGTKTLLNVEPLAAKPG